MPTVVAIITKQPPYHSWDAHPHPHHPLMNFQSVFKNHSSSIQSTSPSSPQSTHRVMDPSTSCVSKLAVYTPCETLQNWKNIHTTGRVVLFFHQFQNHGFPSKRTNPTNPSSSYPVRHRRCSCCASRALPRRRAPSSWTSQPGRRNRDGSWNLRKFT
jgi:hypothetical protein